MPGTIQVSVLDLMDFPSVSSSSSISIKVSLGKREYQTWDKGDFYFPLIALRDKLIVTLLDAEGNELSQIGVETMSVVEKGVWDDLFPLEGGGYLHMKLQFILNDEERKRIKEVRESAMKKKHSDFLDSATPRHPEAAAGGATMEHNFASLSFNNVVEDSQEAVVLNKAVNVSEGSTQHDSILDHISGCEDLPLAPGNTKRDPLNQVEKIAPDQSAMNLLTDTVSEDLKVLHLPNYENLEEKNEIQSLPNVAPVKPVSSQEAIDFKLGRAESFIAFRSISATPEEDYNAEKKITLERTPSNIKKLISAFESSLSQELKPSVNPPTTKSQSSKFGIEGSLKDPIMEGEKLAKTKTTQISEKGENISSTRRLKKVNLQQGPDYLRESEDHVYLNFQNEAYSNRSFDFKEENVDDNLNKDGTLPKNLTESSKPETDTVTEGPGDGQPYNLDIKQKDSAFSVILEGGEERNSRKNVEKQCIREASYGKEELVTCFELEHCSYESLGSWIFSGEMRHLCITTGSKQMKDLMGRCIHGRTPQREMSLSKEEAVKEQDYTEGNKDEETSHGMRESKLDRSADIKFFGGLPGQIVKMAIMVAFGTLVLITRERKTR